MDYTTIRIRTDDYLTIKELAEKDERPIVYIINKLLKAKGAKAKPKPKHHLFDDMKEIYCEFWLMNNGFDYKWNGVIDNTALNRLIKTCEDLNVKGESLTDFFTALMTHLPQFYKNKSINAINKNVNGIIADIKSGNTPGQITNAGRYDFRK